MGFHSDNVNNGHQEVTYEDSGQTVATSQNGHHHNSWTKQIYVFVFEYVHDYGYIFKISINMITVVLSQTT